MKKKPKSPAPPAKSKSFIRTKEEQQKIMQARQREEAALIAKIEAFFVGIKRQKAENTARARAQAKAQKLSPEATKAIIKQTLESRTARKKPQIIPTRVRRSKVSDIHNMGEARSELSRLLGIGKRE